MLDLSCSIQCKEHMFWNQSNQGMTLDKSLSSLSFRSLSFKVEIIIFKKTNFIRTFRGLKEENEMKVTGIQKDFNQYQVFNHVYITYYSSFSQDFKVITIYLSSIIYPWVLTFASLLEKSIPA